MSRSLLFQRMIAIGSRTEDTLVIQSAISASVAPVATKSFNRSGARIAINGADAARDGAGPGPPTQRGPAAWRLSLKGRGPRTGETKMQQWTFP